MTKETVTLNSDEQRRAIALTTVLEGRLRVAQAAELLRISLRHCQRLPAAVRKRVVRLAQTTYAGLNHQHLTEISPRSTGWSSRARPSAAASSPQPPPRPPRGDR